MQKSGSITVGIFEIPVTPELRALFARTHMQMSGAEPAGQQYPKDEQYEMIVLCIATVKGKKHQIDAVKTEANLLELIHFLHENEVSILDITGRARCYSGLTARVSMRLYLNEKDARKKATLTQPRFLQQAFA